MEHAPSAPDRFPLWLVYAMLVVLGLALGVWGAFLVPLRLPGGVEGLSVVLALGGNTAVGVLAARGASTVPAAAMPGVGWVVAIVLVNGWLRPSDEVIIPGKLASDPGVATVGSLFLVGGIVGAAAAVFLANRFIRPGPQPTSWE